MKVFFIIGLAASSLMCALGLKVMILVVAYLGGLSASSAVVSSSGPPEGTLTTETILASGKSGFVTVDSFGSQMFYWFFPAQNLDPQAPLILWLQGGPGSSGMLGLLKEFGPLYLDSKLELQPRLETWNQNYGLLFVDSPVGTGYSYPTQDAGYTTSERDIAQGLYAMLQNFYKLLPAQAEVPFYIAGESYAGHMGPAFCDYILSMGEVKVAGLILGDTFVDPAEQILAKPQSALDFGLITPAERDMLQGWALEASALAKQGHFEEAFKLRNELEQYVIQNTSVNPYDVRLFTQYNHSDIDVWANYAATKKLLGVALNVAYGLDKAAVKQHLLLDEMMSVAGLFPTILEQGVPVLLYQGQFDWKDGVASNAQWLRSLTWKHAGGFDQAARRRWYVKATGELAGFVRSYANLCQITVLGAGHLLPMDQPLRAHDMVRRFIENETGLCGQW